MNTNTAQARLMHIGNGAISDTELLDMAGAGDHAALLLKTFGSFAEAVTAPIHRLSELGVSNARIARLKVTHASTTRMLKCAITKKPALSSWTAVIDYLRMNIAFADVEEFHVLFLDKRNRLIADECQQRGTVDHTPVYPRQIAKRALQLDATALILVHNHPSGDPEPSRADIDMTKQIIDTLKPLGIAVHDHVIVSRDAHKSMKALALI